MTTTLERPADSAGALYRRTDISPEDFFQTLGRVRRSARDEIERLIEWLDSTIDSTIDCDEDAAVDDDPCDGDPDAEPALGSFDRMSDQIKAWQTRPVTADVDCELDTADREPSLGSGNTHHNQTKWTEGNTDDREGCEHDGRELDVDDEDGADKEPMFGWSEEEAARGRYPSVMGARAEHEGE